MPTHGEHQQIEHQVGVLAEKGEQGQFQPGQAVGQPQEQGQDGEQDDHASSSFLSWLGRFIKRRVRTYTTTMDKTVGMRKKRKL